MRHLITLFFILSLLTIGFLSLNYLWNWVAINYTTVVKAGISVVIGIFILTGLAMVFSASCGRDRGQPDVGKKD